MQRIYGDDASTSGLIPPAGGTSPVARSETLWPERADSVLARRITYRLTNMKRNLAVSQPLGIDQILHRKPGHLIRRLQRMAVSIFFDETSEFDITPVQLGTLLTVSVFPGIDQLRVANAIGFDRTTISGVVDRLEAKKLLVRQQCGTDRRKFAFCYLRRSQAVSGCRRRYEPSAGWNSCTAVSQRAEALPRVLRPSRCLS
jgi:DNA-binding MarR family transcriptional regulator